MRRLICVLLAASSLAVAGSADAASSGIIRVGGSDLNGLLNLWEAEFAKLHPELKFENRTGSGDAAIGALEAGSVDIVANGREPVLTEFLSFAEVFGNDGPFQVTVATGSAERLGRTWAQVIYVNSANPLAHMTMAQLEGVFGGFRTGGYSGYHWTIARSLPESATIRSWGKLGLQGKWAKRPIHTYGYAPTGMSNFFEQKVFRGGTSWAPGYRAFVEASAKQATERAGTTDQMMDDLEHDPDGIAWAGLAHAKGHPRVKAITLGYAANGPFFPCTTKTVEERSYPLTRSVFIQLNRPPGSELTPPIKSFLEFILSRQGQDLVRRQGEYLPLPEQIALTERHKL